MKMKDHYEDEMLSKLKALEEEYELMLYFNNFPSDLSTIANEWVKRRISRKDLKRR
ncbi:hypothetical protein [Leclercia adecarboxylata]|uniref:hypothetical protein n=1 Tax=Leclercia adecarboxylata TaxID=83655 RepID=UPI0020273BFA|nr:hypothetical protein [Leclercia adecarboxylata]URM21530.1 hypothetical protein JJN11_15530 [Leclercia adecarboxylata]